MLKICGFADGCEYMKYINLYFNGLYITGGVHKGVHKQSTKVHKLDKKKWLAKGKRVHLWTFVDLLWIPRNIYESCIIFASVHNSTNFSKNLPHTDFFR